MHDLSRMQSQRKENVPRAWVTTKDLTDLVHHVQIMTILVVQDMDPRCELRVRFGDGNQFVHDKIHLVPLPSLVDSPPC